MPKGVKGRVRASCHPDRFVEARGLCRPCYKKQHRLDNLEQTKAKDKAWRDQDYETRTYLERQGKLRRRYGLTLERYNTLLREQNGLCAICKNPELVPSRWGTQWLAVDHCHTTKQIRGLLCSNCNTGLGRFKDDSERLEQAANYLRRFGVGIIKNGESLS